MSDITSSSPCPCYSNKSYGDCCEPFHKKALHAPTAEALMRARYSAYALGEIDYLIITLPLMDRKNFDYFQYYFHINMLRQRMVLPLYVSTVSLKMQTSVGNFNRLLVLYGFA